MPRPVIVISSINQDTTLTVPHFPAPGETLHSDKTCTSLGGKGANVAIAASHATDNVYLVAAVGPDATSEEATLQSHNVDTSYLKRTNAPTGRALILVDSEGENCIIVSKGANAMMTHELPDKVEAMLSDAVVVLQLEIEHGVTQEVAVRAERLGAMVIFNPSPAPTKGSVLYSGYAAVWKCAKMVVVNEVELEQICGIGRKDGAKSLIESWREGIEKLVERCRHDVSVVVTVGEDGVLWYHDGKTRHFAAMSVDNVVDTTGAGDTFTGFIAGGVAQEKEFEECVKVAVTAAGICVTRIGAADSIPRLKEVEEVMAGTLGR